MEKCLLVLIFIAVLTCSISANTKSYCKNDSDSGYEICGYADSITVVQPMEKPRQILVLNIDDFSAIAPYTFLNIQIDTLQFSSPSPDNCNPKVVDLSPESFDGLSVSELNLECVKFEVKPNPSINLTSISSLKLKRVELMGNISESFTNFPLLKNLELFDFNITIMNGSLEQPIISDGINVVEPKSFKQLHNLEKLALIKGQLEELQSGMFYGLAQLRTLNLTSNKIMELRKHTFNGSFRLENLDLNDNNIRNIEPETFSGLNLHHLHLRNNNLTNLSIGVFSNLANLFFLDLSFNKIEIVPGNVFDGCIELRYLLLNYNGIYNIKLGAFWDLNLNTLNLYHNHLTSLQNYTFTDLRVEGLLDLRSNNISKIEPQAFSRLTAKKVSLCFRNTTQVDRVSWGVNKSLIKDIVINDC